MMRIALQIKQGKEKIDLWCMDDVTRLSKEDYDGSVLPQFLTNEKDVLLQQLNEN
jgi:hypothetical protein